MRPVSPTSPPSTVALSRISGKPSRPPPCPALSSSSSTTVSISLGRPWSSEFVTVTGAMPFSNGSTRIRTFAACMRALDHAAALADDLGRLGDRLAVAHARLVDLHVQLKVAQQAVLDHFQVQLAHAADQRLAGFRILVGAERRVLLAEHRRAFRPASCGRRCSPARSPSR